MFDFAYVITRRNGSQEEMSIRGEGRTIGTDARVAGFRLVTKLDAPASCLPLKDGSSQASMRRSYITLLRSARSVCSAI